MGGGLNGETEFSCGDCNAPKKLVYVVGDMMQVEKRAMYWS